MASLFPYLQRVFGRSVSPTQTAGRPGVAIWSGYVEETEKSPELATRENRYRTYSDILANTSIVAAGVRYFLNLIGSSSWSFVPADVAEGKKYAEMAHEMLTEDPKTPWHRIVRRAAMYRFYGFSVQEWTARRHAKGWYTIGDIAPRAQRTIERWNTDEVGDVLGLTQRDPQTSQEIYLPRSKIVYLVDDSLHESPEGLGIFRHLAEPSRRLKRYLQLEGIGYETDLSGVPLGRGPFSKLLEMVDSGQLEEKDRIALEEPLRKFIENHVKGTKTGLLLDSQPFESADDAGSRPSTTKQWDLELLQGSSTSFDSIAAAIERLNREMARILGVEQLLLGSGDGSYALSSDKTHAFYLIVDGALTEINETFQMDILKRFWTLNGWPIEAIPKMATKSVRFSDVEQIGRTLASMAQAGMILDPDDPAWADLRDLLGISQSEDHGGVFDPEGAPRGRPAPQPGGIE